MNQGSNRYIAVHVAIKANVGNAAAVDPSSLGLKFFDDLHGSYFWGSGDGSPGKTAFEEIDGIIPSSEFAADRADHVMHGGIALDFKQMRHMDGSGRTIFTDVVSKEIDDHEVFATIFWTIP